MNIDNTWIKEEVEYIDKLSNSDKYIIKHHIDYGDNTKIDDICKVQILKVLKIENIDAFFTETGGINENYMREIEKYCDEIISSNREYLIKRNKNDILNIILNAYPVYIIKYHRRNRTMKVNINTKNKTRRKTHSKYENTSLKGIPEEVIQDFRESVDKYKYLFGR